MADYRHRIKVVLTPGELEAIRSSPMWGIFGQNYAKVLHYALQRFLEDSLTNVPPEQQHAKEVA